MSENEQQKRKREADEQAINLGRNAGMTLAVLEDWMVKRRDRAIEHLAAARDSVGRVTKADALDTCHQLLAIHTLQTDLERSVKKGTQATARIVEAQKRSQ